MLLDLKVSIATLGIGSGAYFAGLYGMNLKNYIEESDIGFLGVTAWSGILAALICMYGFRKLRRVQKVSMWGEEGSRSSGTWTSSQGPLPALPGESRSERQRRLELLKSDSVEDGSGEIEALDPVELFPAAVKEKPAREKEENMWPEK